MRVSLSLDKLDAELNAERNRRLIMALVTIIVLGGALMIFMGRVVLRPIARVSALAGRVGSGDFSTRVSIDSDDEIGRLGTAINDMTAKLKGIHEELEAKNRQLDETLNNLRDSLKRVELLEQVKSELSKFVPPIG